MLVHGNVAMTALLSGDLEGARRACRDELRLCRQLEFRPSSPKACAGSPRSPPPATTSPVPPGSP
jgi:hypothetical protein